MRASSGVIIGFGVGGFIDGIVFHQLIQWHNMGSAVLPPVTMAAMRQNMAWDGLFHVGSLVFTLAGVFMLWREARHGTSTPYLPMFAGELLLGWGLFNLIEGIIDHHLLELHHVRDVPMHVPAYDWMFLAIGGILPAAIGLALARRPRVPV